MALSYSCLYTRRRRGFCTRRVPGVEADRLAVVGDGLAILLLVGPGVAAVDVRIGELGIEADRLAVVGDRLVVLPIDVTHVAEVAVGQRG